MTSRDLHNMDPRERLRHAHLVELPYSEVCMHMKVAGRVMYAVPLDHGMAQLLTNEGAIHSAPITRGEAGADHLHTIEDAQERANGGTQ